MQSLFKNAEKTDEESGAMVKINSDALEQSLRRYSAPDEEDEESKWIQNNFAEYIFDT